MVKVLKTHITVFIAPLGGKAARILYPDVDTHLRVDWIAGISICFPASALLKITAFIYVIL